MKAEERVTPDYLLSLMGSTPADNVKGMETVLPWKSMAVGVQARMLSHYNQMLELMSENHEFFGPLSYLAGMQSSFVKGYIMDPMRAHARLSVRSGRDPDIYRDVNGWIYKNYARIIYSLCDCFINDGKFDRKRAKDISTTPEGRRLLSEFMQEFSYMESCYASIGLSRLNAMKELMTCLLIVITETPTENRELPFMRKKEDGTDALTFDQYLTENRKRFECLHKYRAFDLKEYAERATQGKIGFSAYEVIKGSRMAHVSLRHYKLPAGSESKKEVVYISTPLINRPEVLDLAEGRSVVEGLLREGYEVYMLDCGVPKPEDANRELGFYAKTIHDHNIGIIEKRHPNAPIHVLGYCMGGTLILAYLARRAEERIAEGKEMDIKKVALMAAPVLFDDDGSGHGLMRAFIRRNYDPYLMKELFGSVNVPPQVIEFGMNEIQPGVQNGVLMGFYGRATSNDAVEDSAPFLYWLTHGTLFPAKAHREWINVFLTNPLVEGKFALPSAVPDLNGKPIDMKVLQKAGVQIFDYRGSRDPISPPGSCVASEIWGNLQDGKGKSRKKIPLNRTIEKNVGHIFVVSRRLLSEYMNELKDFLEERK